MPIVDGPALLYIGGVQRLTRHEQLVLCIALGLFVLGWAVKICRARSQSSPALAPVTEQVKAK